MKKFFSVVLFAVTSVCASFSQPGGSPSGRFYFIDGTAALPPLTWIADRDTGFYRAAANVIGVSAGGTVALFLQRDANGGFIYGGAGTCDIQFLNAGGIDIAAGGTNRNIQILPSGTGNVRIGGTGTNDNAVAGSVGELISSTLASGSAVSLTTNTAANVTSISLTAGDWDVDATIDYILTGATTTVFVSGTSSTSATFGAQDSYRNTYFAYTTLTTENALSPVTLRYSLSATSTVYLIAKATFSVGTVTAYGTIKARRVR